MDDMENLDQVLDIRTNNDNIKSMVKEPEDNREPETGKLEKPEDGQTADYDNSEFVEFNIRDAINNLIKKKDQENDPYENIAAFENNYNKTVNTINSIKKRTQQLFDSKGSNKSANIDSDIYSSKLISKSVKRNLRTKELYKEALKTKNEFQVVKELRGLNDFNESNAVNYFKKSLEIQYKSFYVQKELLTAFKSYQVDTRNQLASMIKNAGLPDYKKSTQIELYDFEWLKNIRQRLIQNFMSDSSTFEMIDNFGKKWRSNSLFRGFRSKALNVIDDTWLGKNGLFKNFVTDNFRNEENKISTLEKLITDTDYKGNKLLDNAVIKVIPGYLSKILKEVTNIANRNNEAEELVYNTDTDSFETIASNNALYSKKFDKDIKTNVQNIDNSLNKIFDYYQPTDDYSKNQELLEKYSDEDKEKIKKLLLTELYYNQNVNDAIRSESLDKDEVSNLSELSGLDKKFIEEIYAPFIAEVRKEDNNKSLNRELEAIKTNFRTDLSKFIDISQTQAGMSYLRSNNLVKLSEDNDLIINQDELNRRAFDMYKTGKFKDEENEEVPLNLPNIIPQKITQQDENTQEIIKPNISDTVNTVVESKPELITPSETITPNIETKKEQSIVKDVEAEISNIKDNGKSNIGASNVYNNSDSIIQEIKDNKSVNIYMGNTNLSDIKNDDKTITNSITGLFSSIANSINSKISSFKLDNITNFKPFEIFKKENEKEDVENISTKDNVTSVVDKAKGFFGSLYKGVKDTTSNFINNQNQNENSYLNKVKSLIPDTISNSVTSSKEYIDKNVIDKIIENIKSNTNKEDLKDLEINDIKDLLQKYFTDAKKNVNEKVSNVSEHISSNIDEKTKEDINSNITGLKGLFGRAKDTIVNRWNGTDKDKNVNIVNDLSSIAKETGTTVASIIPLLVGAGIITSQEAYKYLNIKSNDFINNQNENSYLNKVKSFLSGNEEDSEKKRFNLSDMYSNIKTKVSTAFDNITKKKEEDSIAINNVEGIKDDKKDNRAFSILTSAVKSISDMLEKNNITMENMKTIADNAITSVNDKTKELLKKDKEENENATLLEQIKEVLERNQKEGKEEEPRAGNWKDRLAAFGNKAKDTATPVVKNVKDTTATAGSGILGLLSGLFGKMGGLGSGILGALGLAGGAAMGVGSVTSKLFKGVGKVGYNLLSAGIPAAWNLGKGIFNVSKGPATFLGNVGMKTAGTLTNLAAGGMNATAAVLQKGPITALKDKVVSVANGLKSQIVKKLGKTAGGKLVATLTSKLAARAVPVAGAALLAYDAYNIYQDMQNGMELKNAVSKNLLGFDVFGDDLPVDENGNPIKPDENTDDKLNIKEKEIKLSKIGEYVRKAREDYNGLKGSIESYKVGFIAKSKLPDVKVVKSRIENEIKNLESLKEKDDIAESEYSECMRIYDDCFKLLEDLEVLKLKGGITKDQKKENYDDLNIKPVDHNVSDKYKEYQDNKRNNGVGLNSATEDIKGINTNKNITTTSVNNTNYTGNNKLNTSSSDIKSKTSNISNVSTKPVNNVTNSKPTVKLSAQKQEIVKIIDDVGKQIGTDPEIMKTIAASESGFDPNAKASTSTASGLFQIINATWKGMVDRYGKKYGVTNEDSHFDPVKNSILGGLYIKDNINAISKVKPDVNATDAYMGHFLGAGGARTFLRKMNENPNQTLEQTMPNIVSANKYIAYKKGDPSQPRTLREVYELMGSKIQKNARHYGFNVSDEMVGLSSSNDTTNNTQPTTSVTPPPINNENISKVEPKSETKKEENTISTTESVSPVSTTNETPILKADTKTKSPMLSASEDIANSQYTPTVDKPVISSVNASVTKDTSIEPKYDFTSIKPKQDSSMIKPTMDTSMLGNIDKTLLDTLAVNRNMDATLTKILDANLRLIDEVKNIHIEQSQQTSQSQTVYAQNTISTPTQPANHISSSNLPRPTMNISRISS